MKRRKTCQKEKKCIEQAYRMKVSELGEKIEKEILKYEHYEED